MRRVLVLGGTTEASALASALADDARFAATLSYAGRTRTPRPPPVPWRVGGFGGTQGLADYLRREAVELMVDATHPFAVRMKAHAEAAARLAGVKLLAVLRPPWRRQEGECWIAVADMLAAARALGPTPRRVLLTIGQNELAPFRAAPWHRYVVRSIDAPEPACLPPGAEVIAARGPFNEQDECRLLVDRCIEVIVSKNSGGVATEAKLHAARRLGLPVVMIERPPPPPVETVADAAGALRWLVAHHDAA